MQFDHSFETIYPSTTGVDSITIGGSTAVNLPSGATSARPSTPTAGGLRFNTDLSSLEFYTGTSWASFVTASSMAKQLFYASPSAAAGVPSFRMAYLSDLSDTTISSPAAGQGLVFDGVGWTNSNVVNSATGVAYEISTSVASGVLTIGIVDNPQIGGTSAMRLPVGTTAQRAGSGAGTDGAGDIRFNSTLGLVENYSGSAWMPAGRVVNITTGTIAAASGTGTFTLGTTAPTSTNGFQIFKTTITPTSTASKFLIQFYVHAQSSIASTTIGVWLLNGTTTFAQTFNRTSATAATHVAISMAEVLSPGSTTAITLSARMGASAASTTYCNTAATNTMGAKPSSWSIIEYI